MKQATAKKFVGLRSGLFLKILFASAMFALMQAPVGLAAIYYVSPDGNDSNGGTLAAPFASITKAQSTGSSGDTIYLRGGTYTNFSIAKTDSSYNYIHNITKSGISYLAYSNEVPIFNFTNMSAASLRVCAFLVTGSSNKFQAFQVTGIQVGSQEQSECFRINGGNGNVFEKLTMHDCPAIGIYIQKSASSTLVENCDCYNLIGVSGISAGNIDGFGCHSSGSGNTFRYCRSWHNSDDGFDCINAAGAITFDHCWAYNNGVNGGNANGFKVGGWGSENQNQIPNPVPVHAVRYCLAANNGSHGFYANHQPGQSAVWTHNTSFNNSSADFDMLERTPPDYSSSAAQTSANDIAGTNEVMHFNLAYMDTLTANLNESGSMVSSNSWTLSVTVNSADFQSTASTQMTNARNADGSLPDITFMHLVSGSDLVGLGCFDVPAAPAAPIGLTAIGGIAQVALNWPASVGATTYNVKRSIISGGPYTTNASPTVTNYLDTGLSSGTSYYYVVSAVNSGGQSTNSIQVAATTIVPQPPSFGNVLVAGAKIIFSGTQGVTNGTYNILTTTNLHQPAAQWQLLATNSFDANGNFNFTNALDSNMPQRFYILQLP